ncbi:uncharacterized protein VTP21DRAFT_9836 [Calcarisporiella thermophila]|uniref:uncharacterized protein n=1 Tax=Calcarisporiella thermophila TaxID=911321 RepID=UPI0037448396
MPRDAFDRRSNAQLVARALEHLDIPAYVNERHDIAVEGYKVSGSAYKLINKRAYHHGTMLIDTDLEALRKYLRNDKTKLISKGVASVRSPVANLRDFSWTVDHPSFCEAVTDLFINKYNFNDAAIEPTMVDEASALSISEVKRVKEELETWNWIYGQTPEFTYEFEHTFEWGNVQGKIKSRHALINEIELKTDSSWARLIGTMEDALIGCQFDMNGISQAMRKLAEFGPISREEEIVVHQVWDWLKESVV